MLSPSEAGYVLFHVVEVPEQTATYDEAVGHLVEEAKRRLSPLVEWLRDMGYTSELKVAVSRDVVTGVLEALQRESYAVVVLHRKKRGRLERLRLRFTKSTSERLLRQLRTPILVFPVE